MNNLDSKVDKLLGTSINESITYIANDTEEYLDIISRELRKVYEALMRLGLKGYLGYYSLTFILNNEQQLTSGIILDALEDLYGSPEVGVSSKLRIYNLAPTIKFHNEMHYLKSKLYAVDMDIYFGANDL